MNSKRTGLCALLLVGVNLAIALKLFGVAYSAYNESVEGTFIALVRLMIKYPGQWQWWPFWNGGLPFENTYLPLTPWLAAGFSLLTGTGPARSFHIVTAAIYTLSALAVFWMALEFSRRLIASFIAALAYSCVSVSALFVPAIATDAGGAWNLRRLQILVYYGEAPHTLGLALLPVAVICFSRALTTPGPKWKLLAGLFAACVFLSNAFGIMMLTVAVACWLIAYPGRPWWKPAAIAGAIGVVACAWISPWLSPAMIRGMRANSAVTGGDYRYTSTSWIALAATAALFVVVAYLLRRFRPPPYLSFFALFAFVPTVLVVEWSVWKVAIIPQPHRYQLEMDLALLVAIVFAAAALLDRAPARWRSAVTTLVIAGLAAQTAYSAGYARRLIRGLDGTHFGVYKMARWLDRNRPGQQAFISGPDSFLYNAFTDNPQLTGGHNQHTVNTFLPIVEFTVYSDTNAGDRAAGYSVFWLKAFGARVITVPGPGTGRQPFVHPRKFDGVLPLVWREGQDSIYEVPARSTSLAHVIPRSAIVARVPIHGLDTAPAKAFVAALDDPTYPPATFRWKNLSEAEIRATAEPGQAIAVQMTYERGWEAWANGRRQTVRGDGIGQMVIEPDCSGTCEVLLRYTGGWEHILTRSLSLSALLAAGVYCWWSRASSRSPATLTTGPLKKTAGGS